MKKILVCSVVAVKLMEAGGTFWSGDPVAVVFWGQIGFAYQAQEEDYGTSGSFGDQKNNAFSSTAVLGLKKELYYGFGFGTELAGWTDFGFDIAVGSRVESTGDQTDAEVSQVYLTYTFGNTAIKIGRQALSKEISPWAWTDRSAGVTDWSYDGIVIANTDFGNTTLLGAWIAHFFHNSNEEYDVSDGVGLFMLGVINKSLIQTTINVTGYYIPESKNDINRRVGRAKDTWALWADVVTDIDDLIVGVQGVYVDGKYLNTDATFAIAGKIGSKWNNINGELVASYISAGDYSLMMAGTRMEDSALWTDNEDNADIVYHGSGDTQGQTALIVKAGYKLSYGRLYWSAGYWNYNNVKDGYLDHTFGTRLGYRFNLMGVDSKVEYRYRDRDYKRVEGQTRQRIRVEAYYKF